MHRLFEVYGVQDLDLVAVFQKCVPTLDHDTTFRAHRTRRYTFMAFFNSAVTVLQTLVIALGAGLGIWGAINLLEGYGNDNPGANAHVR